MNDGANHSIAAVHGERVFKADRLATLMIGTGAVLLLILIALAVMSDASGGFGGAGTGAIVCLVVGIWKKNSIYVAFYPDYFETKLAPVAGWNTVLYSEVTRVEVESKRLTVYFRKHNAAATDKPAKIRIRLTELREEERQPCVDAFRARLPEHVLTAAG